MRVAVFEDDEAKWVKISDALVRKGVKRNSIARFDNVAQSVQAVNQPFDLYIIDIRMPGVSGGASRSTGTELLHMLDYSGKQKIPVLAITSFPHEIEHLKDSFVRRGCIVFDYQKEDEWSQALDIYLAQANEKGRYDIIIFAALQEERDAYAGIIASGVEAVTRNGFDIWEFELADRNGAIVLLQRMGLVNAAITVARTLETYAPAVVAMSGICAGLGKETVLGQLLVADVVWEYQSGKWVADAFEADPYQVSMPQKTRDKLAPFLQNKSIMGTLEQNFRGKRRPSEVSNPRLAVFATGSAVIASEKRLEAVKQQHRKVSGLDMEVFGFHRAVEMSGQTPHAFSAKVVVDKADDEKDDKIHEYGCAISADFVVKAVKLLL